MEKLPKEIVILIGAMIGDNNLSKTCTLYQDIPDSFKSALLHSHYPTLNAVSLRNDTVSMEMVLKHGDVPFIERMFKVSKLCRYEIPNSLLTAALCYVILHRRLEVMTIILEDGIDPNLGLYMEEPPLCVACSIGYLDAVDVLVRYGANVNTIFKGKTPLMISAISGYDMVMQLLLESGALVDYQNNQGMAAIHFAAASGTIPCLKVLISHNASIHIRCHIWDYETPLLQAIQQEKFQAARFLIQRGALSTINN